MSKIEDQLLPHQRLVQYNYITLPHDNIGTLMERFGSHPDWILQVNKLSKPEDIRPGMRLKIPVAVPYLRSIWARGRRIHIVEERPYGRKATRASGMIHLSAIDRDDGDPDEVQFLHATWPDPRDKALYSLEWAGLRASRRDGGAYGGVGIQVALHGQSGAGDPDLPETTALAAVWGWGRIFRNGKPLADNVPVHAAILGTSTGSHVFDLIAKAKGLPDGFTHLQARTVDLCLSD